MYMLHYCFFLIQCCNLSLKGILFNEVHLKPQGYKVMEPEGECFCCRNTELFLLLIWGALLHIVGIKSKIVIIVFVMFDTKLVKNLFIDYKVFRYFDSLCYRRIGTQILFINTVGVWVTSVRSSSSVW